jgi:RimJ/RimL family protein N-acetyltransferase
MLPDGFHTARLLLRPITAQDAGPIFDAYAQDPEVTRFLTWRPHRSQAETDAYIAHCVATPPHVARTYVLTEAGDGAVIGAFDLRRAAEHRLDCGYVLAHPWWGRGLMTEVLTEVAAWALAQPSVFRIGAVCDTENLASAKVMQNAGLIREGALRRWTIHPNLGDEPRDCLSYARVR